MNWILPTRKTKTSFFMTLAIFSALVVYSFAGTVVVDTTTYSGADESGFSSVALPEVGAYYFDMVVTSSGTAFSTVDVYMQQEGIAGGDLYTIFNGTFTQCTSACSRFIVPDMYLGGRVRGRWTVTGASATIKVTARKVSP